MKTIEKPKYSIVFSKPCIKDIQNLPQKIQHEVKLKISELASDPRPPGSIKLSGISPAKYRIRCGDYRIIYAIHDHILEVLIIEVGHRREVYR